MSKPATVKLLADVDVYKVGHHGSLNATPKKSLWNNFARRSKKKAAADRLTTVVSTMKGKHGEPSRNTEVPRRTLMDTMRLESSLHTTEELDELFEDIPVAL